MSDHSLMLVMLLSWLLAGAAVADTGAKDYPFPVEQFRFTSQQQELVMAYMDVLPRIDRPHNNGTNHHEPERDEIEESEHNLDEADASTSPQDLQDERDSPDPRTGIESSETAPVGPVSEEAPVALLLHGKNFCAPYWESTIGFLRERGFRVVVPEQVGFCGSSLPQRYQYTFHQLATNTADLLDSLEIGSATVIGHSMGGMLATRFALMYPERSERLVMINPIGLEDWLAEGVPYISIDDSFQAEQQRDFESIQSYQKNHYYDGQWNDQYEHWARMLADTYEGPDGDRVAWNHALTTDMVLTQPVLYEFGNLVTPTTLIIGLRDTTAPGSERADPELAAWLGNYPRLARITRERIPGSELITFDDVGHMPMFEAPDKYFDALEAALFPDS